MHPEYERSLWTIGARPDPSGYLRGMIVRRRQATAALVVAALLTSGCGSPATPPTPDPTASSSSPIDDDAAAFAAAEATYRAYVDALNAVDLSDPATFEPVYALTTGEMRDEVETSLGDMRDQGWRVEGDSVIGYVVPQEVAGSTVSLDVCLDVGQVIVKDVEGKKVTSEDRTSLQRLEVVVASDETGRRVQSISPSVDNAC